MKRKRFLKVVSMVMVVILMMSVCLSQASAEGLSVSQLSKAEQIERLIEQRQELMLAQAGSIAMSSSLQEQLDKLEEKLLEAGAERVTAEKFLELNGDAALRNWNPSEVEDLFSGMYNIWGYQEESLYHLIFESNGSDPYLMKSVTKNVYGAISPNTVTARYWISEIIQIYGEKLVGGIVSTLPRWVSFLPYEILFTQPPRESEIYSSGNALILSLHTTVVQKFVFKCVTGNTWNLVASVNKVKFRTVMQSRMMVNGIEDFDTSEYVSDWKDDDYLNATTLAHSNSGTAPSVRCINKVRAYSSAMNQNVAQVSIIAPSNVSQMSY